MKSIPLSARSNGLDDFYSNSQIRHENSMTRFVNDRSNLTFNRVHSRVFHLLIAAASAAVCCGCAEWDMRKNIPWGDKDKSEVPNQLVAFWTDAVQTMPGTTGKRGFGGRLYFYAKDPKKPVKVNGIGRGLWFR